LALALELLLVFKGWVLLHIQGEDRQCGAFLNREHSRRNWKEETLRLAA
jgi:hemerythrin